MGEQTLAAAAVLGDKLVDEACLMRMICCVAEEPVAEYIGRLHYG
jgi:hypothetical protein